MLAGKKIAILAGQGALQATDGLERVAEILGAPIVKALLGKAAVRAQRHVEAGQIVPDAPRAEHHIAR